MRLQKYRSSPNIAAVHGQYIRDSIDSLPKYNIIKLKQSGLRLTSLSVLMPRVSDCLLTVGQL